jgi:UDP-glucose 4-epimerase
MLSTREAAWRIGVRASERGSKVSVLVTGGLGYIGSHACAALLKAGFEVVAYDDVSNAESSVAAKIQEAVGAAKGKGFTFVAGDVRDTPRLEDTIRQHHVDTVMHFAAKKAVGESVARPALYYDVNVGGLLSVLRAMALCGVSRLIFSSSATVYGEGVAPFVESMPTYGCNPYGWSKVMCERVLMDAAAAGQGWHEGFAAGGGGALSVGILRYFNPLGAHASGLLGENPKGIPNNLLPYIVQTALGQREKLQVFGGDYPTRDGTCERDYIHVCDVVDGHILALDKLAPGVQTYNLGVGRGVTVLEVIAAFEEATGVAVPYEIAPRREGDIAISYADVKKAAEELGFVARHSLTDMCRDHYRAAKALGDAAKK